MRDVITTPKDVADSLQTMTYEGLQDLADYIAVSAQDMATDKGMQLATAVQTLSTEYFAELLLGWARDRSSTDEVEA